MKLNGEGPNENNNLKLKPLKVKHNKIAPLTKKIWNENDPAKPPWPTKKMQN